MNKRPFTTGAASRLFLHMKKTFPSWMEQFDSEDHHRSELNCWYEHLKHFSLDDIRLGIDNWKSKEPPSLEQFAECCKPSKKPRGNSRPEYPMWNGNEPVAIASQSTRLTCLDKIKRDL